MDQKQIFAYRVKGDPRGWAFSDTPFMADDVTPGPREEDKTFTLGEVSDMLTGRTIEGESAESATQAIIDVIPDTYIVMNENALGFVHGGLVTEMEVLASLTLQGGPNCLNGPVAFNPRIDRFREATLADFEEYRVSPRGHLHPI